MRTTQLFKTNAVEADVVDFNGRLIVLYVPRDPEKSDKLIACDYFTGEVISESSSQGLFLGNVKMIGSVLHLWGTTLDNKQIKHTTTTDLVTWTTPAVAWTAASGQTIYNTSVCFDPVNNRYIMAYETSEPYYGFVDFNIRFFESTSPAGPWNPLGGCFGSDRYVACPFLWHCSIDNYFYMFFLVHEGGIFKTRVARASDPTGTWVQSGYCLLEPRTPDELNNTSDLSFTAFHGVTRGVYCAGNQTDIMGLKQMLWEVTPDQLCQYFTQ